MIKGKNGKMEYDEMYFGELLDEITEETERIKTEMNIHDFNHAENIATYNRLTTILLMLKEIG